MRAGWFENINARNRLMYHAGLWKDTPFVAHAQVRGSGVDCIHLAAALYQECGFLAEFKPPKYSLDGGMHNDMSQVLKWLDTRNDFRLVYSRRPDIGTLTELVPGDLLCFLQSRSAHHVGVLLELHRFIHARAKIGVTIEGLADPLNRRTLAYAYRPLARREEA